jgi:hypothetical protein
MDEVELRDWSEEVMRRRPDAQVDATFFDLGHQLGISVRCQRRASVHRYMAAHVQSRATFVLCALGQLEGITPMRDIDDLIGIEA